MGFLCVLAGCGRLDPILHEPPVTPEQWCAMRPCVRIGDTVLNEPLGTLLVFSLALLWLAAGLRLWHTRSGHRSRAWLGVGLVLGGIGAGLAGVSYQAFSYELKCAGRTLCIWTNGFEVAYMIAQTASVGAMLIAVAHACTAGRWRFRLIAYALANCAAYTLLALAGALLPARTLISFEVLLLFALPVLLAVLFIAGRRYAVHRDGMAFSLLVASVLLLLVHLAYFTYDAAGITQRLWRNGSGFYFSANDVLHVGMIGWIVYVIAVVAGRIRDTAD